MIYFNTVKLDGQSRLYIDSKIRETLKCVISRAVSVRIHGMGVGNSVVMAIYGVRMGQVDTLCAAGFLNGLKIRVTCIHADGNSAASLSFPRPSKY